MANINDIKNIINNSETTKILATVGINGIPHTSVKQTIHINEEGNIEYVELFESSQSYRNITGSIWYDKKVSIAICGKNKESYTIIGRPVKILITGRYFEEIYSDILEKLGFDMAAVVIIEPESIENQSPRDKFEKQEKDKPFFKHLDRIKKA
ncbi:hypothetical protein ACJDU8_06705 [Clostridium sp. WILCCON 0269]|uniref:Pyridoxamine 5'-phosphate oxidase putative domain-containing protein n=1 Tax=Candidatus Clostridium eludens TaxID=3381663 RepID=A0ABW8SHT3_9CLOT